MKDGGFADSPLRLNRSLAKLEHWNEGELVKRAEALADLAVRVWAAPSLPAEFLGGLRRRRAAEGGKVYTLADHGDVLKGSRLELFEKVRKRILNLSSAVREEVKKHYIAYKAATNFVDIEPQKQRLKLTLNMTFDEVDDPEKICRDVSSVGHYGNGDVEFGLTSPDQIDYALFLIQQAYEKQREDVEA
jgi:predicted transport protein